MKECFWGMDLGGTNVGVGLLDGEGEIIAHRREPSQIERGPNELIKRAVAGCKELIRENQLDTRKIKAVGIGSPGPLSVAQGKIIKAANLPGFDNFAIRAEMSRALGIPAVLDNDANAACWGEFWLGAGKDVTDMVMFTLGTGIGGGIVCAGELVHGSEDNGAELGHMIIVPDGRACNCGQKGCLEAYSSASQTAARANEALKMGAESSLQQIYRENGQVSCKDVFDHAKAGDEFAGEIVEVTAKILAVACVNMRHITEPQRVVLTGGMIHAGPILTEKVGRFYDEMMWKLKADPMDICFARLGDDAGVIGAAGLALHAYHQGTLPEIGT